MTTPDTQIGAEGSTGTLTTRAGRATNLRPDMKRIARYDPAFARDRPRVIMGVSLAFGSAIVAGILYFRGAPVWITATLGLLFFVFWVPVRSRLGVLNGDTYTNGLLVPGLVTATEPLTITCLADMRARGAGDVVWGVRHVVVRDLGTSTTPQLGDRIPCVSLFVGLAGNRWKSFEPRPMSWGFSDAAQTTRAVEAIPEREWQLLAVLAPRYASAKNDTSGVALFDETAQPLSGTTGSA